MQNEDEILIFEIQFILKLKNSEPLPRTVENEVHDGNRRGDLAKNEDD